MAPPGRYATLLILFYFPSLVESQCTLDNLTTSILASSGSKVFVNMTLGGSGFRSYTRYMLQYCIVANPSGSDEVSTRGLGCSGPVSVRTFSHGTVLMNLDSQSSYAFRLCCGIDKRLKGLTGTDWTYSPYRLLDLSSNRSDVQHRSSMAFLEPDRTWKTSERSSVVILVIGASAIAVGVPFAIYIACRRQKEERRRTISLVTGALR